MRNYQDDYEDTVAALDVALRERGEMDAKIDALQQRVDALEVLIQRDDPAKFPLPLGLETTESQARANRAKPRVTELVKGLLTAFNGPLTTGEILVKLKQMGWDFSDSSNKHALIHGVCRRLVQQKFAHEVEKGVKKAWQKAP